MLSHQLPQSNLPKLDSEEQNNNGVPYGNDKPPGYVITLRNTGQSPVTVNDITTAFFTAAGSEMGSDAQPAGQVIAPGNALNWTFPVPDTFVTSQTDYWGNPADYSTGATSCTLETWY